LTGCDQAPLRGQQPEKPPALPEDLYLLRRFPDEISVIGKIARHGQLPALLEATTTGT